jgi:hypothetical protein
MQVILAVFYNLVDVLQKLCNFAHITTPETLRISIKIDIINTVIIRLRIMLCNLLIAYVNKTTFRLSKVPNYLFMPVPLAARSKAQVNASLPIAIVGSSPNGSWMFFSCVCVVCCHVEVCATG